MWQGRKNAKRHHVTWKIPSPNPIQQFKTFFKTEKMKLKIQKKPKEEKSKKTAQVIYTKYTMNT